MTFSIKEGFHGKDHHKLSEARRGEPNLSLVHTTYHITLYMIFQSQQGLLFLCYKGEHRLKQVSDGPRVAVYPVLWQHLPWCPVTMEPSDHTLLSSKPTAGAKKRRTHFVLIDESSNFSTFKTVYFSI